MGSESEDTISAHDPAISACLFLPYELRSLLKLIGVSDTYISVA